jgi:hypothetical protein
MNVDIKRHLNAKKTSEEKTFPAKSVVRHWTYFCPQAHEFTLLL